MRFFLTYHLPLFILIGFWLFYRIEKESLHYARLLSDALVMGITIARFFGSSIPPSGHALFLTHSLLTVRNKYYRLAAFLFLIVTVGLKISWHDYESWVFGIGVGLITGTVWLRVGPNRRVAST